MYSIKILYGGYHRSTCRDEKKIDGGQYFVISRGRQYGKTKTLNALREVLSKQYLVLSLEVRCL